MAQRENHRDMTVNERIKIFLEASGISQTAFAKKTGLTQSVISKTLGGKTVPQFSTVEAIVRAFPSLNPHWLILGEGSMNSGKDFEPTGIISEPNVPYGNTKANTNGNKGVKLSMEITATTPTELDLLSQLIQLQAKK